MAVRTVVVTGASTGIGATCVTHLVAHGFRVAACMRTPGEAPPGAAGRVVPLCLDVTDPATIAAAASQVGGLVGDAGLAGLVNNAGIAVSGPLEAVSIDELRRQLEVNVVGQVAVTQAFLPLLRTGRGRIVNMGSVSGRSSLPGLGPYAASKFALEAITDALRQELRAFDIHVAVIEPGAVATPIWAKGRQQADPVPRLADTRAHGHYGRVVEALRTAATKAETEAVSPDVVARAVHHALTSARPRTRYLIGRDARLQAMVRRWLPDRWGDAVIRIAMGL